MNRTGVFFLHAVVALVLASEVQAGDQRVDLRPRATGYLVKVLFNEGDNVKKGQALFEIDPRPYRALLEVAEAEVTAADAKVQRLNAELMRVQVLLRNKLIGQEENDKINADRTEAMAQKQVSAAKRVVAQLNLEFTTVRAPIDGKIGRPLVTEGNLVKADETSLAIIVGPVAVAPKAVAKEPEQISNKIKDLMKERLAILKKKAEIANKMHKQGTGSAESAMRALREVNEAELELCDSHADRLELLRKDLQNEEKILKLIRQRHMAGAATEAAILEANASVLQAQIRLLREEERGRNK